LSEPNNALQATRETRALEADTLGFRLRPARQRATPVAYCARARASMTPPDVAHIHFVALSLTLLWRQA